MQGVLHAGVDRFAMWVEDRVRHDAERYLPCRSTPLDCFGPLERLPPLPDAEGRWSAPSPRPLGAGDRMTLHVFARRAPFRGTVVVSPPWKIGSPARVRQYTDLLSGAGYDVWVIVPPEHMERASPGTRSGHGFATLDLGRFRSLFEQLVLELRTALAMAAARGPAGLVALSVGALAASFAIASREAPGFAALVAPPADLAAVMSTTAIGRRYARLAARAGSRWPSPDELGAAFAVFDPRRLPPPSSRLLLAVGRYDRIALTEGALELADAWRVSPNVYARGHLTLLFCCRALFRDLARFVSPPDSSLSPGSSRGRGSG